MGDFPEKPVKVSEISRVTTPVRRLSRLGYFGPAGGNACQQTIYLRRRADVMGKGEAAKTGALSGKAGVSGQAFPWPKSQPCFPKLKEGNGRWRLKAREAKAFLVEPGSSLKVRYAEGDKAYAGFHGALLRMPRRGSEKMSQDGARKFLHLAYW
ncbi:MAG: hypothetical protein A2512_08525 [Deltaproteobacteria bacterium RIFOXYD12_FULL_56_24]|nr:MAG: hypothetical protein A2512_08525 [Deltaproteobacteria bacterium RIFOXYD12_FULL_56_24]